MIACLCVHVHFCTVNVRGQCNFASAKHFSACSLDNMSISSDLSGVTSNGPAVGKSTFIKIKFLCRQVTICCVNQCWQCSVMYVMAHAHSQSNHSLSLRWRHDGRAGVSTHQPHECLLNFLFRHRSKKTSKLRVTCLCEGNSPWPVNSPHKGPVTRKMLPFDDVIMLENAWYYIWYYIARAMWLLLRTNGRFECYSVTGSGMCMLCSDGWPDWFPKVDQWVEIWTKFYTNWFTAPSCLQALDKSVLTSLCRQASIADWFPIGCLFFRPAWAQINKGFLPLYWLVRQLRPIFRHHTQFRWLEIVPHM